MRDANIVADIRHAILDSACCPFAVVAGSKMTFAYANDAFCLALNKNRQEVLGQVFSDLLPENDPCLFTLKRAYSSGACATDTVKVSDKLTPFQWSCNIWPISIETGTFGKRSGLVLEMTRIAPLMGRITAINEALLLSSVRQHELIEEAETLVEKLKSDVEERQRAELEVRHLAFYDPLTDLPNRRLLLDRMYQATLTSHRSKEHGAIFFLDLDQFKTVNDSRGHHVGDVLLQEVARRLRDCLRAEDTVARLGGDEFVAMVEELSSDYQSALRQAKNLGLKLLTALRQPYELEGRVHNCSGSIGVTLFDGQKEKVTELLKRADTAQYRAKTAGGDCMRFFDVEMQANLESQRILESDLKRGLKENQFRLHYQPQFDHEGVLKGYEALLRWAHPTRGLLLPAEFILSAEESGYIESIGLWVLSSACRQLILWSQGPETSSLTLSINVSAREFANPEFVSNALEVIRTSGVKPAALVLEVTERMMFDSLDETRTKMISLGACGLTFALDDFGVGYSSLACLKTLPISQLKIDRSFVRDVVADPKSAVITSAMIVLGRNLNISVMAEGIETEEQHRFLRAQGCALFQGFLFGRPLPVENLMSAGG